MLKTGSPGQLVLMQMKVEAARDKHARLAHVLLQREQALKTAAARLVELEAANATLQGQLTSSLIVSEGA